MFYYVFAWLSIYSQIIDVVHRVHGRGIVQHGLCLTAIRLPFQIALQMVMLFCAGNVTGLRQIGCAELGLKCATVELSLLFLKLLLTYFHLFLLLMIKLSLIKAHIWTSIALGWCLFSECHCIAIVNRLIIFLTDNLLRFFIQLRFKARFFDVRILAFFFVEIEQNAPIGHIQGLKKEKSEKEVWIFCIFTYLV